MKKIRTWIKPFAAFMAFNLLIELIAPTRLWALTEGPSQPEVQSFQPIGVSDMVNTFTGDFSYNIPLLDIDGYPINISYNGGISNDQEASWVGLGWNINPGVINRSMRGLPDEFNGGEDRIEKEFNMKNNWTIGATFNPNQELFGAEFGKSSATSKNNNFNLSMSMGVNYNSYNGFGLESSLNPKLSITRTSGKFTSGLGINSSSNGLTISPSISFEKVVRDNEDKDHKPRTGIKSGGSLGTSFNSRSGMNDLSIGATLDISKTNKFKIANGGGLSVNFGLSSYTPTINMPMRNTSLNFSYSTGGELFGLFNKGSISGYYSEQGMNLVDGKMSIPAYGYNNSHNGVGGLMDINRDWDVAYNINTPSLPITNFTFDILSVAGQGMGGSFRPFRSDYGYVADNTAQNLSAGGSLGIEVGTGNTAEAGSDISVTMSNTTTGAWTNQNDAAQLIDFKSTNGNPDYEAYAYKEMGELSVDDEPTLFESIGNSKAVRIGLEKTKAFEVHTLKQFESNDGGVLDIPTQNYRNKRIKRNQTLSLIRYDELAYKGLNSNTDPIFNAPDNHIGEIDVTRNDGVRYIYGIPAFNTLQEEVTFNCGMVLDPTDKDYKNYGQLYNSYYDNNTGYFAYETGDNTINNNKGRDHFYSSTKMPAYAHSYLLTAVLSPDYVDIDNTRGPSKGDIGNFTVFKYNKLPQPYKWRTPYDNFGMTANFNEGLKSDVTDDKASFTYGEKEMWYLDKIETKNTVAVFVTEDRKDAFEAGGRDGGIGTQSMKLLRKISLYSRPDYEANGNSAVPIKEVHFEYDYSLCPNVLNNSGEVEIVNGTNINENRGKLTLKRIYFTYGTSVKSKFSPYDFDYTNIYDENFNPDYNPKNYDRWGGYKPNEGNPMRYDGDIPSNSEYPYTEQDKTLQDKYSTVWTLSKITLPSGGTINIESESDDYAYVQDKKAMRMYNTLGFTSDVPGTVSYADCVGGTKNELMDKEGISNTNNLYITIPLDVEIPVAVSDKKARFRKLYLPDDQFIYFKCLVNISGNNSFLPHYEYVSGWAEIDYEDETNAYGTFSYGNAGDHNYGWIKLKTVNIGDKDITADVNPICKAAWHFGRMHMPKVIYNNEDISEPNATKFIKRAMDASFLKNLMQTIGGANGYLNKTDCGKQVNLKKSFIRLNAASRKKLGGGLRVKKIAINDEWEGMVSGGTNTSYGQEYEYLTTDASTGEEISSGVAAYEPGIGADENPLKQPIWYGDEQENILTPDDNSYFDGPVGESFFPSPIVGYSKVKVKNFGHSNVKRHGTGYVVNEYYTAKDFPTIVEKTTIDIKKRKTKPWFKILKLYNRDYMTVSQGYSIELNDMHGKQKAMWVYAEDKTDPISGVEYRYKSKKYNDKSFRLENTATVVRPDGSTAEREIGLEFDFVVDFREQETENFTEGLNANLTTFLAGFIPGIVPTLLPAVTMEKTRFRSAVATKIINRYGILSETIAHDLGSSVSTQNLAYDSETGLVLLTKTKNNFEDDIYSFNYPAHWYYDAMGQAYKNLGLSMSGISIDASGYSTITNAENYFVPGDELVFNNIDIAWVSEVSGNSVKFINEMGNAFRPSSSGNSFRIVRSGRRNLIGVSMGTITSLTNPLPGLKNNSFSAVLNTSSQVFKDNWNTFCECFTQENSIMKNSKNPYATGNKGIWRAYKSFAFLTQRNSTWKNKNTNIRTDGIYNSFNPYWKWENGSWVPDETNWTWTAEVTEMSPYGAELENKDALLRFSAATYGYNNTVPTGVAANSRYAEVGFDGFEDYNYATCSDDHFSFKENSAYLTGESSHTGKKSMRISVGNPASLTKTLTICESE